MTPGPVRTCAGCRKKRPQGELLRVADRPDGSVWPDDSAGRSPGRGAYICPDPACIERAVGSGALHRALRRRVELPQELIDELVRQAKGRHG